jgi:hypothetical protein
MTRSISLVLLLALIGCNDDPARPVVQLPSNEGGLDGPAAEAGLEDAGAGPSNCDASFGSQDLDRDSYSRREGDCDDCDPLRGPFSIDVPGNGIDEDCSGADAPAPARCDEAVKADEVSTDSLAAALGICRVKANQTSDKWGLMEASFKRLPRAGVARAEPAHPRQLWLPERFGTIQPSEGGRLVVLSTGIARDRNAEDEYTLACDAFDAMGELGATPPAGYPRDSEQCESALTAGAPAFDDVGFELKVRAPMNATAIAFESMFFTYEYPTYVCKAFNDFFAVFMTPAPRRIKDGKTIQDGNIMLDENEDAIGVNSGLLSVCGESLREPRVIDCKLGASLLEQTGYGAGESTCGRDPKSDKGGASTGWLATEVPVEGGKEYTFHFVLWDSGDASLDSTVVLDNFRFVVGPPIPPTQAPTRPITGR